MAQATLDRGGSAGAGGHPRRYGWLLGRELLVVAVLFVAYRAVRMLVKDQFGVAFDNARRVIDWERAIGIFNEVDLQHGILGNDAVIWFLNRYYFFGHFGGAIVLLIWLYTRHFERYGRVRRVMAVTTGAALAIHVAFPLAPPRWFPEMGFVDTLQTYGPKVYDSGTVTATANQIAAMPSLHVGWALILAWAVVTSSSRPVRWLAVVHPMAMALAVVLTANHWWLDAAVAAALVTVAIWVDTPIQRRLERRHQRRRAEVEATAIGPEPDSELAAAG